MTHLKSTAYVTFGILTGSFFSYLLQLLLANRISLADFGAFNAILAITSIVAVPSTVFSTALIKKVAVLKETSTKDEMASFFWQNSYYLAFIGGFIFVVFLLLGRNILEYFNIRNYNVHLILGAFLALTYLWIVPYAFLQGLMRYKRFSLFLIFNNLLRLVIPMSLVIYSYSMSNLFLGIFLATFVSYLFALLLLRQDLPTFNISTKLEGFSDILTDLVPVLLLNLSLLALVNVDQILVKKYFDAQTAGYYAGAVTLGKIFLFAGSAVATVMFPKIAASKSNFIALNKVFKYFFTTQLFVTLLGVICYILFPTLISNVFFGDRFAHSATYLAMYALFIGLFLNVNFLSLVLVALDSTTFTYWMLPLVLLQYLSINLWHTDVFSVLYINVGFALVLFVLLLANTFATIKKSRL